MSSTHQEINLSYLESIADGDQGIINELVTIFLDQIPEFTDGFNHYYSNKDWKKLAAIAHKAKSSVRMKSVVNATINPCRPSTHTPIHSGKTVGRTVVL